MVPQGYMTEKAHRLISNNQDRKHKGILRPFIEAIQGMDEGKDVRRIITFDNRWRK
jgi:hypothetical protein